VEPARGLGHLQTARASVAGQRGRLHHRQKARTPRPGRPSRPAGPSWPGCWSAGGAGGALSQPGPNGKPAYRFATATPAPRGLTCPAEEHLRAPGPDPAPPGRHGHPPERPSRGNVCSCRGASPQDLVAHRPPSSGCIHCWREPGVPTPGPRRTQTRTARPRKSVVGSGFPRSRPMRYARARRQIGASARNDDRVFGREVRRLRQLASGQRSVIARSHTKGTPSSGWRTRKAAQLCARPLGAISRKNGARGKG
jgi:hypothetical protein